MPFNSLLPKGALKPVAMLIGALVFYCGGAMAQLPQQVLIPSGTAKQVSPHVWVIMAFPNIGIVVGDRATLVVDTGLGERNGATVASEARKLSKPGARLYLTTTHFHPEHAGGDQGFPADTIIIRNAAQQKELDEHGDEVVARFRNAPQNKDLLEGQKFRKPDIVYDRDARVNLGGVTARLMWLGAAHTVGDELTYVEEDGVLISGDVVQNKVSPNVSSADASFKSWLAVVEQIEAMHVRMVVPDHSAVGDGSMVEQEKMFLSDLESLTAAAKGGGKSADDAAQSVAAEMKQKYADWIGTNNLPNLVKRVYAEQ